MPSAWMSSPARPSIAGTEKVARISPAFRSTSALAVVPVRSTSVAEVLPGSVTATGAIHRDIGVHAVAASVDVRAAVMMAVGSVRTGPRSAVAARGHDQGDGQGSDEGGSVSSHADRVDAPARPVKRQPFRAGDVGAQRTFAGMASMPRVGKAALLRFQRLEAPPEVSDDGRHRGMAPIRGPAQVDEGDVGGSLSAGRIAASAIEAHAGGSFREIVSQDCARHGALEASESPADIPIAPQLGVAASCHRGSEVRGTRRPGPTPQGEVSAPDLTAGQA